MRDKANLGGEQTRRDFFRSAGVVGAGLGAAGAGEASPMSAAETSARGGGNAQPILHGMVTAEEATP